MMESPVGKPHRAYGARGNIFSFLMPWEDILGEISNTLEEGDLSEWPLSPGKVQQIIRVRLVSGPEEILNKFKDWQLKNITNFLENTIHLVVSDLVSLMRP